MLSKQITAPLVGIIVGEHSGDILGAGLITAIKALYPDARFVGIAGPRMQALGCESLFDMENLAVMGVMEVLGRLPTLLKIRKQLIAELIARRPDVVVGIDAPDFNLTVELKLKQAGLKTVHYVSPSVWAWRHKRIFKIAAATHRVLSLLPFEKAFYDKYQVPCTFVGHTLADELPLTPDKAQARSQLQLSAAPCVALMPGSRGSEVGLLAEPFLRAAQLLKQRHPDLQLLVPLVNDKREQQFQAIWQAVAPDLPLTIIKGQSRQVMMAADAAMIASGTATLEAMLLKLPMVVAYRFKWLSYQIFKRMISIKYFSLPNLLADCTLVTELLQDAVTPEALAEQIESLLGAGGDVQRAAFLAIHQQIRLDASAKAAQAVIEVMNE